MGIPPDTRPRAGHAPAVIVAVAAVIAAAALPAGIGSLTGWDRAEMLLSPLLAAALLVTGLVVRRSGYAPLFGVLAAATGGLWVITVLLTAAAHTLGSWPLAVQMVMVNGAKIIPVGLVVIALWRTHGMRQADLRAGSWRATSGLRLGGRDVTWDQIGPVVAIMLVLAIVVSGVGTYNAVGVRAALVWLPVYAIAAIVNSAAEEFLFRHSINAATRAVLGPAARIALTSVYFGLSHIHGTPSGLAGVLLTGAFGAILAWSIECTRGYGWNWMLHGIADFTIFATLIAATP